jgi:uncharacterized protein (TIGR02996 family)
MNHEQAFLQAIREAPDDDAPRLIYADWLEEQGGAARAARAAFIRIQCRLNELSEDDPAREPLEDEAVDLLAEYEYEWTQPLHGIVDDWRFSRGFVEHIRIHSDNLLTNAEALFAFAPLTSLHLRLQLKDVPHLAACRQLQWVQTLSFSRCHLNDRALQQLLLSPHLHGITALYLDRNGLNTPGVRALLQSPLFARLRLLDLSWNRGIGNATARLLAQASRANNLEALLLNDTNLSPDGLRELFEATSLPHLTRLEASRILPQWYQEVSSHRLLSPFKLPAQLRSLALCHCNLAVLPGLFDSVPPNLCYLSLRGVNATWSEIEWLAKTPTLTSITHLDLGQNNLSAVGVRILADSPCSASLRYLGLDSNNVRDAGAKALADSQYLRGLRELSLAGNGIGGPGLKALVESPNIAQLRSLDLGGNFIGGDTVRALAESAAMRHLTRLDLSDSFLEEESARALASSASLERLTTLLLKKNLLGDSGARALAQSQHLTCLTTLDLNDNRIGKAGAEALAAASWRRMRTLDLRGNVFTDTQEALLRQRFGNAVLL